MGIELGAAMIIGAVVTGGATAYSSHEEAKAAEYAAELQAETAQAQLDAVAEQEAEAQETAQAKLKAAQARQTDTILTTPAMEEANVNTATTLGV